MSRRVREIEEQLALLEWRKSQNTRRIHETLIDTKQQHKDDTESKSRTDDIRSRAQWKQAIADDEWRKPLTLPQHVLKQLEDESLQRQERAQLVRSNGIVECKT